jgi:thiamine biosynthesis lipoprotein
MKLSLKFGISVLFLLMLAGCDFEKETIITGKTMGTTYNIKVVSLFYKNTGQLKVNIEERLKDINKSMSIFLKESEISRFNKAESGEKFAISADFLRVMKVARKIYELSEGAWDGTVYPLVELWGFGAGERKSNLPDKKEIEKVLTDIGFDKIEISEGGYLEKRNSSIGVDLASIAKGYGVDAIAEVIRKAGFDNFLIEIGGEVYASGLRKDGGYWHIGINTPDKNSLPGDVYKTVRLKNKALATSGDYRNFYVKKGGFYSHIINPKTGYPVNNGVVSVSVVADDCTFADGLATAITVTGPEKGIEIVEKLPGVECLVIIKNRDGRLSEYFSKGFKNGENTLFER